MLSTTLARFYEATVRLLHVAHFMPVTAQVHGGVVAPAVALTAADRAAPFADMRQFADRPLRRAMGRFFFGATTEQLVRPRANAARRVVARLVASGPCAVSTACHWLSRRTRAWRPLAISGDAMPGTQSRAGPLTTGYASTCPVCTRAMGAWKHAIFTRLKTWAPADSACLV
jgi:hypothetical protein